MSTIPTPIPDEDFQLSSVPTRLEITLFMEATRRYATPKKMEAFKMLEEIVQTFLEEEHDTCLIKYVVFALTKLPPGLDDLCLRIWRGCMLAMLLDMQQKPETH